MPDHLPQARRGLRSLTDGIFDILVVGGGVLGACTAWDAALRGLRVALVERGDFGAETSSNSLKTVHGGLRYLQHLGFLRMRESIRERSIWLRMAPHLVEPLPILIPARGLRTRGLLPLSAATLVHDLVGWDRNQGVLPGRQLPRGRVLSRAECLALVPEVETDGLAGGILVHDAQLYSSERLILEVLQAAAQGGAAVANHVEFETLLQRRPGDLRLGLRDRLTGDPIETRARVVVNAAGASAPHLAAVLTGRPASHPTHFSLALNLIVPDLGRRVAFAISGRTRSGTALVARGARQLFIVPWRGRTMIGTAHYPYSGDPARIAPEEQSVERFLDEINAGWPGRPVRRSDVVVVHRGLLPCAPPRDEVVRLLTHYRIHDHAGEGIPEAVSALSVKLTEGRGLAERVVDLVCRKLGRPDGKSATRTAALPGGGFHSLEELRGEAGRQAGDLLPGDVIEHLVRAYGTRFTDILRYRDSDPEWNARIDPESPVIRAQLLHGARAEWARSVDDLLYRRTELGATGRATDEARSVAQRILEREAASRDV